MFDFFILGWSSNFNSIKNRIDNSELAMLLARVSFISKFSTILLNFASSSLLLIVLMLLFKITDSLWKAFSEKRGPTVFQNFLLSETIVWSSFTKKRILILRGKLTQKFLWRVKHHLDSLFLVFTCLCENSSILHATCISNRSGLEGKVI